jgi:hypothetical protein
MGLAVPLMDCSRIANELGWSPRHSAEEALLELLDGLRRGDGAETPPLAAETSGAARAGEVASGVGSKNP